MNIVHFDGNKKNKKKLIIVNFSEKAKQCVKIRVNILSMIFLFLAAVAYCKITRAVCKGQEAMSFMIHGKIETVPTRWHLAHLKALEIKATFMIKPSLQTKCVQKMVREIHSEGHVLGLDLNDLPTDPESIRKVLIERALWVHSIIGVWPRMVSLPSKFATRDILMAVAGMGMVVIPESGQNNQIRLDCNQPSFDYNQFLSDVETENIHPSYYIMSYSMCPNELIYQSGRVMKQRFNVSSLSQCTGWPSYFTQDPIQ